MNIHPSYERLIKYAAGDTQEDAAHIMVCVQCGETVSNFRYIQELIRNDDFVTPPDRTIARAQAIFVPHRFKPRPHPTRLSWSFGFAIAVSSFVFFCVGVLFAQVTQSGITIVIGPRSPSAPALIEVKPTQSSGTAVIEFPRHTPIPTPQDQPPKVPKLLLPLDTKSDVPLFPDQASTTITLTLPITSPLPVDVGPTPRPPASPAPAHPSDQESPQPTSAPPQPTSAPPQPTSAPPQPTSAPPQPTSAPPQPTSAPPQPTSPPPEPTSAPPPQPTSTPPPTSAPPPQPTSTPPPSKTPPVINPGQWNA